ncbi:hypothetical protein FPV67DRAFT_638697 [Lyophyllum atratum]|nr:hypothetical protein FPV67DRAFT_638697 [Lyophyllum atratum]
MEGLGLGSAWIQPLRHYLRSRRACTVDDTSPPPAPVVLPETPPRLVASPLPAMENIRPTHTYNAAPGPTHEVRSSYASSRQTSILSTYSQDTINEDDDDDDDSPLVHLTPTRNPALSSSPIPISPTTSATPATTTTSSPPTAGFPDTSTSTYFDTSRISLALSDGEVGIGLSLLQDLADGGSYDSWSDSDSDSGSGQVRRRPSRKGSKRSNARVSAAGDPGAVMGGGKRLGAWRESVLSQGSAYSRTSDEGLGYEDTETGHSTQAGVLSELDADITQTQNAFFHLDSSVTTTTTTTTSSSALVSLRNSPARSPPAEQMTFPPVAPLSPSRGSNTNASIGPGSGSVASPPSVGTTAIRTRSRSNTNASLGPGPVSLASPPSVGTPLPPPPPPPLESESKSSGHGKTDSESDASVYTQPSPLVDGSFTGTSAPAPPRTSSLGPNGSLHRPAPLKLGAGASHAGVQGPPPRSPLLHTTWGSPLSSPALQKPNGGFAVLGASDTKGGHGALDSPPSSAASNTGYTGTGEGFRVGGGVASASAGGAYFPAGESGMGGMASAMRQRLEVERKPSVEVERGVEERARRIVVEEEEEEEEEEEGEDEVVIGDVSFGSSVATERGEEREREGDASVGAVMHESPSLSSSPELLVQGRLAPLGVADKRSPSVSSGEEGRQGVPIVSNPPPSQAHLGTPALSTLRPPSSTTSSPSPSHLRPTLSGDPPRRPAPLPLPTPSQRPQGARSALPRPHVHGPAAAPTGIPRSTTRFGAG